MIAAACQLEDQQGPPASTSDAVYDAVAAAVALGAKVVCVPEAFLSGYTRDPVVAGERAISLSSPGFQAVCRNLATMPTTVVLGLIETDGEDLFNTAAVITGGRVVGTYRNATSSRPVFWPDDRCSSSTSQPSGSGSGSAATRATPRTR